jgi:hypothetical protein
MSCQDACRLEEKAGLVGRTHNPTRERYIDLRSRLEEIQINGAEIHPLVANPKL